MMKCITITPPNFIFYYYILKQKKMQKCIFFVYILNCFLKQYYWRADIRPPLPYMARNHYSNTQIHECLSSLMSMKYSRLQITLLTHSSQCARFQNTSRKQIQFQLTHKPNLSSRYGIGTAKYWQKPIPLLTINQEDPLSLANSWFRL